MVMRSRGHGGGAPGRGARTGGVQPVYEDYKPDEEWQQNDKSHIINFNLHGFRKDQIKVSSQGRTIKIRGERLVGDNKWIRIDKDIQVPKNGELEFVRAKLEGGVLRITVPKKEVAKPQETLLTSTQKRDDVQKQTPDTKYKGKVFPEASTKEGHDNAFPTIQSDDKRNLESQKASDDYTRERDRIHDQTGTSVAPFTSTGSAVVPHDDYKKKDELKEINITSDRQDDLTSNVVNKKTKKNAAEFPEDEAAKNKSLTDMFVNKANDRELYKQSLKGLAELNEERQLLVNVGVALLVVVALATYVTCKFASGKAKNV